ncbi:hypothetical protein B1750_gp434 [Noumeavirus]|uniref:hypothetical protein n=1 Tax=Noumeavirus TaxID=1955558 RepID=UPI000982E36C|nr:hypothetical protein B1750_gp434 [Noumeavirus]AQM73415.1 hypothetical protein NMV_434 [Noumeavirus]
MSREKRLARQKRYYENHKEEEKERLRLWYAANKDKIKEKNKAKSAAKKEQKKKELLEKEESFQRGQIVLKIFPDVSVEELEEFLLKLQNPPSK